MELLIKTGAKPKNKNLIQNFLCCSGMWYYFLPLHLILYRTSSGVFAYFIRGLSSFFFILLKKFFVSIFKDLFVQKCYYTNIIPDAGLIFDIHTGCPIFWGRSVTTLWIPSERCDWPVMRHKQWLVFKRSHR